MKSYLFLLAGAALSLASCSQEKTTETTTTPTDTTTTTTTTTSAETDAMIEARAQRIADKMVADMKITDEALKTKIRTAYVNRGKRMRDLRAKYTADTTGQAAAMRDANTETDTEFKTIYTDPTQYQAYESSRSTYDDSNYMDSSPADTTATSMAPPASDNTMSSGTDNTTSTDNGGAMVEKSKSKMADGSKVKVKDYGKVKVKDADGEKAKIK